MNSKIKKLNKIDNAVFPVFMLDQRYFEQEKNKQVRTKEEAKDNWRKLVDIFSAMAWNG